ncbi:MAG: universal stress protein [Kofleriaceae bacterium]|nr:universal stress protein [Kofleriaceae bacterium]
MKRILVAIDSSPRATTVLDAAGRLAQLTGASLIVFRAIAVPPDLPREILELSDKRLEEILVANARADVERRTRDLPAGTVENIITELATAWDGICRKAREIDADLIVIGSHGYGGIDRLIGTTAAKVVNHTDRNVLVVRTHL